MICENPTNVTEFKLTRLHGEHEICHQDNDSSLILDVNSIVDCRTTEDVEAPSCFYKSVTFWSFVVLTYIGTIGFNVGKCRELKAVQNCIL